MNQGGAEVSFLKVVYTLQYPSNACVSYLDGCFTSEIPDLLQVFSQIQHLNTLNIRAFFTCHCLMICVLLVYGVVIPDYKMLAVLDQNTVSMVGNENGAFGPKGRVVHYPEIQ